MRDGVHHRQRRDVVTSGPIPVASPGGQYCGNWSTWVNNSYSAINETELATKNELQNFCPNGRISAIKCKDDKGEPFKEIYNKTSGDNKYVFTCGEFGDGSWGIKCHTINVNASCPDYAFQVSCNCKSFQCQFNYLNLLNQLNTMYCRLRSKSVYYLPTNTIIHKISISIYKVFNDRKVVYCNSLFMKIPLLQVRQQQLAQQLLPQFL